MAFKHLVFPVRFTVCLLVPMILQRFFGYATLSPHMEITQESSQKACDQDFERKSADCWNRGLDVVPQNLSVDIEGLVLMQNHITSLLNSSFKRYPLITDLNLSKNDIRVIESFTFYPLSDLMYLSISSNYHIVLPATGLFKWAGKLSILDLSTSNLKSLPDDTLQWSTQLDTVKLHINQLTYINVTSCGSIRSVMLLCFNQIEHLTADIFNIKCHINTLDLRDNPIQSVDPNVIASLRVRSLVLGINHFTLEVLRNLFIGVSYSTIEELKITDANLTFFPTDFFDPLRNSTLHVLDFTENHVNALYPFVFSNLTLLHRLTLSDNDIFRIQPNFFKGMQKLRVLDVNNNKMEYVNHHGQIWTVDLLELHISGNRLTDIPPYAFLGLRNLTFLDLSSNKELAILKLTTFTGLHNIQKIDLSGCSIVNLVLDTPMLKSLSLNLNEPIYLDPVKTFKHAQSLVNLDMRESDLYIFHLWDETVNISIFDELHDLTILDMGKNHFDSSRGVLPPGIFQELSALKKLSLDHCQISYLHPLLFTGLESLQELNLRGNSLQHLHYNLLEVLNQLINISLNDNLLDNLDEAIFSNKPKLAALLLANNKFTRLNHTTFQPIASSLSSIDLSMNPIVCNCDLKWLPNWLSGEIQLINADKTVCSSSSLDSLQGKLLKHFDPKENCRLNISVLCLVPLAVICMIVITVLAYHNRWQLRYKLFLLKLAVIGYEEFQDARDHNDYEFDLNVIFYDDDEEWIREYLRPALEERLPQFHRNVYGDGDLVLGMHYLDSVDYVVSHSYKTIVVLSRAAVRDRWFMLKFRTAMDHVSDTQTEFVTVVFLGDIPDDEIPFLARLYLSDGRPYLHWTNNVRGHVYFWNELAKNLVINLRTNDLIPNE